MMLPGAAEMLTAGVTVVVTVMVMVFDVAVAGLAQGSFEVSTHSTWSPLAKEALM